MKEHFKMIYLFKHSYSREFGFPITETQPERYCKVYGLQIGQNEYDTAPLKVEYHSDVNRYYLFSRSEKMDKVLGSRPWVFDTMEEAKKAAIAYYNDFQTLCQTLDVSSK